MISPIDLLQPSPAPHFKTFQENFQTVFFPGKIYISKKKYVEKVSKRSRTKEKYNVECINLCKGTYQKTHIYISRSALAVCTAIKKTIDCFFFLTLPTLSDYIVGTSGGTTYITKILDVCQRFEAHMGYCSNCFPSVAFQQLMVIIFDLPDWVIHISPRV